MNLNYVLYFINYWIIIYWTEFVLVFNLRIEIVIVYRTEDVLIFYLRIEVVIVYRIEIIIIYRTEVVGILCWEVINWIEVVDIFRAKVVCCWHVLYDVLYLWALNYWTFHFVLDVDDWSLLLNSLFPSHQYWIDSYVGLA